MVLLARSLPSLLGSGVLRSAMASQSADSQPPLTFEEWWGVGRGYGYVPRAMECFHREIWSKMYPTKPAPISMNPEHDEKGTSDAVKPEHDEKDTSDAVEPDSDHLKASMELYVHLILTN